MTILQYLNGGQGLTAVTARPNSLCSSQQIPSSRDAEDAARTNLESRPSLLLRTHAAQYGPGLRVVFLSLNTMWWLRKGTTLSRVKRVGGRITGSSKCMAALLMDLV